MLRLQQVQVEQIPDSHASAAHGAVVDCLEYFSQLPPRFFLVRRMCRRDSFHRLPGNRYLMYLFPLPGR